MAFEELEVLPEDPILGLSVLYQDDPRKEKINLSVGTYQTEEGAPYIFSAVKQAEEELLLCEKSKNYLPIDGEAPFLKASARLFFEKECDQVDCIQTLGATGAMSVGAEFLHRMGFRHVLVSAPTWPNHSGIFEARGFTSQSYPYFCTKKKSIDFDNMMESLTAAPVGSVLLTHGCCHNPTGLDLTQEQWEIVFDLCEKKQFLLFIDHAYSGFAQDFKSDLWPIQKAFLRQIPTFIAVSYSKNFGLYGERIGFLAIPKSDAVKSHLRSLIRSRYSTPPAHGARIISAILNEPVLKKKWEDELKSIHQRLQSLRKTLVEKLPIYPEQKGLFCYLDIDESLVHQMREKKGLYLVGRGRINISGLNQNNMHAVVAILNEYLS